MSDKPSDLEAMIAQLRKGGVFHAEFHEDGSVKILTMGPSVEPPDETGDDVDDPNPKSLKSQMQAAANMLAFGRRPPSD